MAGNRQCPACAAVGRDKDKDHLFLMKGGDRWACSKNGTYHPPYFESSSGTPTAESIFPAQQGNAGAGFILPPTSLQNTAGFAPRMPSLAEVAALPSLAIRSIPMDVVNYYGVKCECDLVTGETIKHFYPITSNKKIVSYKCRVLPKEFFNLHKNTQLPDHLDLFGDTTLDTKPTYCIITEGQLDAMAAFTMLVGGKGVRKLRVLSLPNGANTVALASNAAKLNQIQHLYYCPDNDDVGRKMIPEVWKLFPHVKIMEYSEKDASDMLDRGKTQEFYESFMKAERYKPSTIVTAKQLKTRAMQEAMPGLSYPFPSLTKYTYGLRAPALIAIGAGPGCGKSTLSQRLVEHLIYHHQQKVGAFFLEEQPADSLRRLAGHIMRLPLHLPGTVYDRAALATVLDGLDDKIMFYDHSGYRDWKDIEEVLRYMAAMGVKYFFIDPLSALHTHLDASSANQFLSNSMFQMSKMIQELNIAIFHINHLNNPLTGSKDHNEGAVVKASQFTGSRAQWRFSTDVWGLSRDSTSVDETIRNTTIFSVLKNRLSGQLGQFPIRYDSLTGTLEEPPPSTAF